MIAQLPNQPSEFAVLKPPARLAKGPNSDPGSQFTSDRFTGVLIKHDVTISMDGRGRALDNIFVERLWRTVKYEDVYLNKYARMPDLVLGLTRYFLFYNEDRRHQSLGYTTPDAAYRTATGGGATIVDKFGCARETSSPVPLRYTGDDVSRAEGIGAAPFRCGLNRAPS